MLGNGLRVVIAPQPGVPIVTVDVTYDVGSRVEGPGRTGLAHLFEHLMFEGSENVAKGEHFRLVTEAGGVLNGTTSVDRTNYFETLPVEALEIGLFLEADRMRALVLSQERLDVQREAVKEEKRLRIDNQPYASSFEAADELAYAGFPYRHSVIGSMEDLGAASLADVAGFYRRWYAPGNALLCIAGDVDPGEGFAAVRRYFDAVPGRPLPPPFRHVEPPPPARRRRTVLDPLATVPALLLDFRVPPRRHPDILALEYAEKILAGGESGTLYRHLVKDGAAALSLSVYLDERRGPSLLRVFAVLRPEVAHAEVESAVLDELERLAGEGPGEREMERARRMLATDGVRAVQTTAAASFVLSEFGLYDGDPGLWKEDWDRLLSVTRDEVRAATGRALDPCGRSAVLVQPATCA